MWVFKDNLSGYWLQTGGHWGVDMTDVQIYYLTETNIRHILQNLRLNHPDKNIVACKLEPIERGF